MKPRIRLGISSCLLGEAVRYDGGHKRDAYIVRTLGRHVEWVPVCPEVGIGLGVPRPPLHLVDHRGAIRARGRDDPTLDVTTALVAYGRRQARELSDISGYVFKSRSPSCGLETVPVLQGGRVRSGRGVYAEAFLAAQPWLPVEEEQRLRDLELRDNFLERVFAYRRWQVLVAGGFSVSELEQFHAAHKLALMAHRPRAVSELGRIVAGAGRGRIKRAAFEYLTGFMASLARPATTARHEKVLSHLMEYLCGSLGRVDITELRTAIRRFRAGTQPRATVLVLLRQYFRRYPDLRIVRQTYLYPDACERSLRVL